MFAQHELHAGRLGRDFLAEIVDRGPQAAIDDHRVATLARLPEGLQQRAAIVAHRGAPIHSQADLTKAAGNMTVICVDRFAGQDLVTGTKNFDAHRWSWGFPWFSGSLDYAHNLQKQEAATPR